MSSLRFVASYCELLPKGNIPANAACPQGIIPARIFAFLGVATCHARYRESREAIRLFPLTSGEGLGEGTDRRKHFHSQGWSLRHVG